MRRDILILVVLALLWGTLLALLIRQPGYTDAYYYFNAGQRLAQGDGLTDPYVWMYINAPDSLPGPSNTYWMPLESLVIAGVMTIGGTTFGVAQIPSILCFAALVALAYWLGWHLGHTRRRAWISGLLVLFCGFFTPFWTTTDTFALYGVVGAGALIAIGKGRATGSWRWYALGGVLSGLAHLTRADGLLFVLVLVLVALWPDHSSSWKKRGFWAGVGTLAYLLVVLPWFARNLDVLGSPLPTGGTQTIWLRGYNELVNYPPGADARAFWDWGLKNIFRSRWEALTTNLGTFIAVETWVILGPFVLLGLWRCRKQAMLLGVMLYALGLHLAMTLVFAYPGYRGGLFHSSVALVPFWASLGVLGLDHGIEWMAKRRRWRKTQAQTVFGVALIILATCLSFGILLKRVPQWNDNGTFYKAVVADLPSDAVLMVNDPPALYYHTGYYGVVVPNADPNVVPEIAARYGVTYLVLDVNRTEPFTGLFLGQEVRPFLQSCTLNDAGTKEQMDDFRICEIVLSEQGE